MADTQQQAKDPFGGQGPFDRFLDPVRTAEQTRPRFDEGRQFSGWEGTAGKTIGVFSKILEGISRGRVAAFAREQQEKADNFGRVIQTMQTIGSNPGVSQEYKEELGRQFAAMTGRVGSKEIQDAGTMKKKGFAGNVATTLHSIFDKLGGGPFKGDPITNDAMTKFMSTAVAAQNDAYNSTGAANQRYQDLIDQGIAEEKAKFANVGPNDRHFPTYQEIMANPKVAKGMQQFHRYDRDEYERNKENIAGGYAQTLDQKAQAQLEIGRERRTIPGEKVPGQPWMAPQTPQYTAPGMQPPEARRSVVEMAAPQPGHSVVEMPRGQQAPESPLAPLSREHTGPPRIDPTDVESEETRDRLLMAAGYKIPSQIPIFDKNHNVIRFTSDPKEAAAYNQDLNRTDKEVNRVEKAKEWWTEYQRKVKKDADTRNFQQQQLALGWANEGIRGAQYLLDKYKDDERWAPERALAKLVGISAQNGVKPSEFADNIDNLADAMSDDPEIALQRGYIINQVSLMKNRGANSYGAFLAALGGGQPTPGAKTPPPPGAPKPQAAPAAPANKAAAGVLGSLGVNLGGGSTAGVVVK